MSLAEVVGPVDEPEFWSTQELGAALIELNAHLAIAECRWLTMLAEFDRREGWRLDGQLSGVDWLVWRCGLSGRTARDKLRVAHALRRRPAVAAAFASGSLSYSKVRAITRVTDADEETDRFLLKAAAAGTVADLERVYHRWKELRDQERGLDQYLRRWDRRRLGVHRTYDKMMVFEVVVPIEEGEEALTHLDAAVKHAVDNGSAEPLSTGRQRVDGFLELLRAGRSSLGTPQDTSGADRYTVHLVAQVDPVQNQFTSGELLDGTTIGIETLRRLSCDAGVVRHLLRGSSQPIDIGRRTSVWTAAQRRAISMRDHGKCRFVGCWRRTCDVHHLVHFDDGGPTAVDNGLLLCPQHHTCVHDGGFTVSGNPNGMLTFHYPSGPLLGTSEP